MEWLLHIDPDEVAYPMGNPSFNLAADLAAQPPHVAAVRLLNYEAMPEAVDVSNPFEQVTLFSPHAHAEESSLAALRYAGALRMHFGMTFAVHARRCELR